MTPARSLRQSPALFVILTMCLFIAISNAQQGRRGIGPDTLPDEAQILGFGDQRFRVVPIKGFFRPSALDFLPNGDILVAERSGGLRIVRAGVLDPEPISGMPEVHNGFGGRLGLWDVAVHPQFAENRLVYFTYLKPDPSEGWPAFNRNKRKTPGAAPLSRRTDPANSRAPGAQIQRRLRKGLQFRRRPHTTVAGRDSHPLRNSALSRRTE